MKTEVLVTLIATSGVVISAVISIVLTRIMVNTEKKKLRYGIETTFYNQITSNRIDSYKRIYQIVSDFKKGDIEYGDLEPNKKTTRISILKFIKKYDSLSSEFGVLYSSETGKSSAETRRIAYQILKETNDKNFQDIYETEYRKSFNEQLSILESQLKADIGIYILEYRDFDRKQNIRTYADVNKLRKS